MLTDRQREINQERDDRQRQKEKTKARCLHTDRRKDIKKKKINR